MADGAKTAASNAQSAANSAKTAADKANSDLAKLTYTVTTQGTKIDQNSDSITSVASRTTTVENKFTDYYTKTETNSQIKQTADGINSTVSKKVDRDGVISAINQSTEGTKVNANRVAINGTLSVTDAINNAQTAASNAQTAVDNIQVGGRNLIPNSKGEWVIKNDDLIENTYGFCFNNPDGVIKDGVTVTISADIKTNGHVDSIDFFIFDKNIKNTRARNFRINPQTYQRLSATLTTKDHVDGEDWSEVTVRFDNNATDSEGTTAILYVRNPKLELGNKPTDWTPAPEDVQNDIDAAQETADDAKTAADGANNIASNAQSSISKNVAAIKALEDRADDTEKSIVSISATQSEFSQTLSGLNGSVTAIKKTTDGTAETVKEFTEWVNFDATGMAIGNSDSGRKVKINEEAVEFRNASGQVTATFSEDVEIKDLKIKYGGTFTMGNFAFIPRSNGNLSIKYIGG